MSAEVSSCLSLKELLKPTGYKCESKIRACCAVEGKLCGWYCEARDRIFYTLSCKPDYGDTYIYGNDDNGEIGSTVFDEHAVFSENKITINGVEFLRESSYDIEL